MAPVHGTAEGFLVRYEDIAPALRAGGRARRAAWKDDATARMSGCWLELVPAHPLPDGRMVADMLLVAQAGGQLLRHFTGGSFDLAEAQDWELVPDGETA